MNYAIAKSPSELTQTLFQITHGLYVLTSFKNDRLNGQCLDALMQVTSRPPMIAMGVGKGSLTHEMIADSGILAVNVLDKDDPDCMKKIKHFGMQSGRKVNKFSSGGFELGEMGAPILTDAKAFFECRVVGNMTLDLGTHTLFVCSVERAGLHDFGEPFTYNEYRKIKFKKGD